MTDERSTAPTFADRVAFERRALARLQAMITPLLDPIDRAAVRMPDGPLKQVGEVQLEVALHADVLATITVSVVGEQ